MESGAIADGQISASSEYDANHAASQGRLRFQESSVKAGSWSARPNVTNQWLQIDLGNLSTKITSVATQGRNYLQRWGEDKNQCVTRYKVQYSDDGVNFQYYREQGQTKDKVKILFDPILLSRGSF